MYEFLKHKILILGMGEETFKKYSNIDTYDIYCWQNKWDKRMFKLCEHIPLKSISSWYAGWNYIDLKNYDTVIITDGIRDEGVIKQIKRKNPDIRVIIYYLNVYEDNARNDPLRFKKYGCDIFSFDKRQAQKACIKHKNYFYGYVKECHNAQCKKEEDESDIFFCGRDKGRINYIKNIRRDIIKIGLTPKIIVVPERHKKYAKDEIELLGERIPYAQIAQNIMNSKAILEIVEKGQTGMTERAMESIFFQKKLITNNRYIIHYDLYNEKNIFVLGERDLCELPVFLNEPYFPNRQLTSRYTVENWLETFFA